MFADLTCDSDGKIDRFIDLRDVKDVARAAPAATAQPYYIGIFLVGAYQEILGDLHNLFGDTNAVHVRARRRGRLHGRARGRGRLGRRGARATCSTTARELVEKVRRTIEEALRNGEITLEESARLRKRYEQGLQEYTYLSRDE